VIFNFALNTSDTIQSFFNKSLDPITVEPHQAMDITMIHGDTSGVLTPIGSFLNALDKKKIKRFYIHRTFALGDILMLVPVIRALRKRGYDPYLRTIRWAKSFLDLLDIEIDMVELHRHPTEGAYGIMLDGTVEQDHARAILSGLHRVDTYFKALGMQKIPRKLDWSMDLERLPEIDIEGDYVAFFPAGSTFRKQLPANTREWIMRAFKEKGVSAIQIGVGSEISIKKVFAIIAKAKCLVTMDSGPLWVSHFTRTPVITLFGPSRPSERLAYHPLWPKRAIGIKLNECLNPPCESCFEAAGKCGNRMDCLKIRPQKIFDLIYPEVKKWL